MSITLECDFCGRQFRVKPSLAGKRVRCPACQSPNQVPELEEDVDQNLEIVEDDDLDFDPPVSPRVRKTVASRRSVSRDADSLESASQDENEFPVLPPKRKKKKVKTEEELPVREVEPIGSRRDWLVWCFLIALLPLAIIVFVPEVSLADRVARTVEKHPELADDFQDYGTQEFLQIHPELTLEGAHLSRRSAVHWLYACMSTLLFTALLTLMLTKSRVKTHGLLLTGLLTGTLGIALLLAFQILAEISLHMKMFAFRGLGSIIFLLIKFIGFSYRCAMDPDNGFLLSFMGFTCGVGFCEEVCKALPIFYYLRNAEKTDWRGTCMLGLASGAGFGISEGIMYSSSYYNGIEPGYYYVVRFLSCVSLHCLWSGSVALLMFGNQDYLDSDADWITFLFGVLQYVMIAMLLHGLYDTLLKQHYLILALLVGLVSFGWLAWLTHQYWNYAPDD